MSETISVHNMFSPCSAKRRASDKDLPVHNPLLAQFCSKDENSEFVVVFKETEIAQLLECTVRS